ncbi:MAG: HAMP domain-containing protein [Pseudobutyrivibrio ruminis]|uniref:sensor histidine kinase n=1 Tax=Pseudobutyrivibrio ruminis TaxID=46206 RepID=UPI0026EF51A6|nr:histidine kinase [Pseudobutyrivibrio ruminis]MBE5914977.1 HAMP domain-containing protein [Pseudobutyrivibrio ruminis]
MKLKLRTKILIMCLCCTYGALLVQTILFANASESLIYKQAEMESYNSLQNMQNELYTYFFGIESDIIDIYNDKEFLRDISQDKDINTLREVYYSRAKELVTSTSLLEKGTLALYLYTDDNETVSVYRKFSTPRHNYPKDIYVNEEQYNSAKVKEYVGSDDNQMLISGYYNQALNRNIIRFVVKIHNINKLEEQVGYVVCDIDTKAIDKIMRKYVISDNTYVWIQPFSDLVLYVMDNPAGVNQDVFEAVSSKVEASEETNTDSLVEGNNVLFSVSQKKYNLTAYTIMPKSLLQQNQVILRRNMLLIVLVLSVVLIVLFLYITKTLAKPLEKLTSTVSQISDGDTNLRIDYTGPDEIGQLGSEFNHMLDEIENLIGQEYENKLLLNKAEYKALQAQINPHFLYNTLDTMSSIASIQNCEIVSRLCQSLSGIFRYSLDMKHPYSTVAQEINHLKNYIFVMDVRMGNVVEYRFDIAEEVLQDTIPRISLQPLVENAINHGIKNKHGDKIISIRAFIEDENLIIEVEDNGTGFDATEMNKRLEENDRMLVEEGNSIGIYNINARLKMLYGEEYGLKVYSELNKGTLVKLWIPRKKIDEVFS